MTFYSRTPEVDAIGRSLLSGLRAEFAGLSLAFTLLLPDGRRLAGFSHRGRAAIYPASVIKLFYMAAVFAWIEAGRLRRMRELDRALAAMIRHSSNDATAYVVDLLTGTMGGPELPPRPLALWLARRQAVNRYFAGWGWPEFASLNASQKTWEDAPYGRERQSRSVPGNRNRLCTDGVARLLLAIDRGEAVSPAASAAMRRLLARDPSARGPENQVVGFLGQGLPAGARLWSKAGWTKTTRHDAAIVRLPSGRRFVLVVFTEGLAQAENTNLLPRFAAKAAAALGS